MIKFGVAGNPDRFYESGFKASVEMPGYLSEIGLDAYEYQCGKGVSISEKTAGLLGEAAGKNGVALSLHAPYYINPASADAEKFQKNLEYVCQALKAAKYMGAKRIVVHSGALMGMERIEALERAKNFFCVASSMSVKEGYGDIAICPETMGKINQLGDLFEVVEICRVSESLVPTIDFGHLNARTMGGLNTVDDFLAVLNDIEAGLGQERMKNIHIHFSKIEYSKGGEKRHLTFDDEIFGPSFLPLAHAIAQKKAMPVIICESAGTQDLDALHMKEVFWKLITEVI